MRKKMLYCGGLKASLTASYMKAIIAAAIKKKTLILFIASGLTRVN
jgi:hypothetical protein